MRVTSNTPKVDSVGPGGEAIPGPSTGLNPRRTTTKVHGAIVLD
jgi:hypothetical protein